MGHTRSRTKKRAGKKTRQKQAQRKGQLPLGTKPHWKFRYQHGGVLRKKRRGRKARPISKKIPIHLVFKAERKHMRRGFRSPLGFVITQRLIKTYSKKFFIKLEQVATCNDHIHLIIRTTRRSMHHYFLRVVAGQIAQEFIKNGFLIPVTPTVVTDAPAALNTATAKSTESRHKVTAEDITANTKTNKQRGKTEGLVKLNPSVKTKPLWKHRPFSRIVIGYKAYQTVRNYVQLNEKEARGEIPYRKERLRGLSTAEWELLWI